MATAPLVRPLAVAVAVLSLLAAAAQLATAIQVSYTYMGGECEGAPVVFGADNISCDAVTCEPKNGGQTERRECVDTFEEAIPPASDGTYAVVYRYMSADCSSATRNFLGGGLAGGACTPNEYGAFQKAFCEGGVVKMQNCTTSACTDCGEFASYTIGECYPFQSDRSQTFSCVNTSGASTVAYGAPALVAAVLAVLSAAALGTV